MTTSEAPALLVKLAQEMADERAGYIARERSPGATQYRSAQATLLDTVRSIGRQGDIDQMLAAEKAVLTNDLRLYGNSQEMRNSIGVALNDLRIAERHVALVRDPEAYRVVDEAHSRPRNRKGAVPWDEARQFFQSHATRLVNMDRSRLTETEKRIIDARKANMRAAAPERSSPPVRRPSSPRTTPWGQPSRRPPKPPSSSCRTRTRWARPSPPFAPDTPTFSRSSPPARRRAGARPRRADPADGGATR